MDKEERIKLYVKMETKFLKGKKEHKGNLKNMKSQQKLKELQDELIDAIFFINSLIK